MEETTDIKTGVDKLQAGLAALQEVANELADRLTIVTLTSGASPSPAVDAPPTQTFPPCTCIGGKPGTPHRYVRTSPTGNACAHYVIANAEKFSNEALNDALGMVGTPAVVDPPAVVESASVPGKATGSVSKTAMTIVAVRGARSQAANLTKSNNLTAEAKRRVMAAVPGCTGFLVNSVDYKVKKGTIA